MIQSPIICVSVASLPLPFWVHLLNSSTKWKKKMKFKLVNLTKS